MKIALDYDRTYSADPRFWNIVITLAKVFGHDIRIVTYRDHQLDRTMPLIKVERILPVIYTCGMAKKWFLTHFGGDFIPDIWIEDKPEGIFENSTTSPENLDKWRANRNEGPSYALKAAA